MDDITRALTRWVVDVYHNTPHEGLTGRTPLDAWEQAMLDWGVTPPPGPELQAQIVARPMQRNLEGDGITVIGVRYHSQELAEWGIRHRAHTVNVRWCPQDIGAIWVKAGDWIKVPAVFDGFSGMRAEEWVASASHDFHAHERRPRSHIHRVQDVLPYDIPDRTDLFLVLTQM